jgi:hypothetical protein
VVTCAPTACRRTVSGSIALRYLRFFSPFLHSTGSLSVSREYLALPDGAGRFRQDFTGPALLRILNIYDILRIRDFHSVSCHFPENFYFLSYTTISPTTPMCKHTGLGSSAFARHYLRNHYYFLFLSLLRCFSSGGLTLRPCLQHGRFPHSDIYGSKFDCNSP